MRIKNYSDSLIDSYDQELNILAEAYMSKAAGNESDRLAAEKAFKDELTNGPARPVRYANGAVYQKKVGSFDLDNMHKAYDEYYSNNDLLDLFDNTGKLINKGTYGRLKDLDKKIPAVSALLYLWGAQFRQDMEFTDNKNAKVAAANKEAEAKQIKFDIDMKLQKEIKDQAVALPEWEELNDLYPEDNKPKIKINVFFDNALEDPTHIEDASIRLENIIEHPMIKTVVPIKINKNIDVNSSDIKDIATELVGSFKEVLQQSIKVAKATNFISTNYEVFKQRAEHNAFKIDDIYFLIYYDPNEKKYYKAVFKMTAFGMGLILIEIGNENNKSKHLEVSMSLIAVRAYYRSGENLHRTYYWESYVDFFNSDTSKAVLKQLEINCEEQVGDNCKASVHLVETEPPVDSIFDSAAKYYKDCDSGD